MTKARGYLLMEVAIGGAMIAVVAATLMVSLSDSRVRNVAAGRDVIATQLALEKIEQERSCGFASAGAAACPCATEAQVTGQQGAYKRVCTLGAAASVTMNAVPAAVTVQCKPVTVTVSYTINAGGPTTGSATNNPRAVTLNSQVCQ